MFNGNRKDLKIDFFNYMIGSTINYQLSSGLR